MRKILFYIFSIPLIADTILLKNKEVIEGKILFQDQKNLIIELPNGATRREDSGNVQKILSGDSNSAENKKAVEDELRKLGGENPKPSESETKPDIVPEKPVTELSKKDEPTEPVKSEVAKTENPANPNSTSNLATPSGETKLDYTLELASDFVFRGQSFGAHNESIRSNSKYQTYRDAWAFQPYFTYETPLKGLKLLFWGNMFLQHTRDKEQDYALQVGPSERDQGAEVLNMLNSGRTSTGALDYDPIRLNFYKEKNGLHRQNGAFTGIFYEWETGIGTWSVGTWTWNNADKANKYTWQEFFVWYKPKILPYINPNLQAYWNASSDHGGDKRNGSGITNGQNYFSIEFSHEYFKGNFFRITPSIHTGYLVNNDNFNQRSGISNITSGMKFNFGNLFTTVNHIFRPETDIWDTEDKNRSDGKTPNPAKQTGVYHLQRSVLESRYGEAIGSYFHEQSTGTSVPKNLVYISFGYENKF